MRGEGFRVGHGVVEKWVDVVERETAKATQVRGQQSMTQRVSMRPLHSPPAVVQEQQIPIQQYGTGSPSCLEPIPKRRLTFRSR